LSSLLWEITPPSGKRSWLFGTMHIRDERAFQSRKKLYELILSSDAFIGEMDMAMPGSIIEQLKYDARTFIKEKAYQKLRKQLIKSFQVDLDCYRHLHPLMVMSLISNSVLQKEHLVSLDENLWNYAKENGKLMLGLESYETQFQILHSIDPGPLYKQLLKIGRNPSAVRKHTDRGINLYVEGRIHELYVLSKSSMHELRKKIIYERNKRMANVVVNLDSALQYFITVGAGHLSGKTGMISMLRKQGYKVKPAKNIFNSED
jgi:uncharacterized protein YbaP (TraB family)